MIIYIKQNWNKGQVGEKKTQKKGDEMKKEDELMKELLQEDLIKKAEQIRRKSSKSAASRNRTGSGAET